MKQQTAMQQLLEYIKHNGQSWRGISADMIEKEFLPLEKEQIVNAYNEKPFILSKAVSEDGAKVLFKGGEQYYSETYEQK